MDPDWKALMPHRPLDPGDTEYVERPAESGGAIADLVLAGKSTVLVAGPVGVGKSTELAAAAQKLQAERVVCLAPLDRWENMRRITADQALLRIAGRLAQVALDVLKLPLSQPLRSALVNKGVLTQTSGGANNPLSGSPAMLARATVEEVTRLSAQRRVAILVDGTEKTGPESAAELFDALAALPEELDLVVVVPWSAAYGPRAPDVIRQGERLVTLRGLQVVGFSGLAGHVFFQVMLQRRIGWVPLAVAHDFWALVYQAAERSGGIPRMFLQLMADAATNARLRGHGPWPTVGDLNDAVADLRDSFRRILLPGDTDALRAVDGTDGREMPLDRKVRLLAHAALLEHTGEHGPIMEPHPLVRMLLTPVPPHA
jgi:hypothetical protein